MKIGLVSDTHMAGSGWGLPGKVLKALEGVGMVHDIQWPGPRVTTNAAGTAPRFPEGAGREILDRKFRQPVDVVVFGDTHQELICYYDGVLLVNPGSPTCPSRRLRPGTLGTVGLLEIQGRAVTVRLVDLGVNQAMGPWVYATAGH